MAAYDDAVAELYRAPHGSFVAERKRLAAELKAAGDKPGSVALGKRGRPTISAWAVNQLWWHARDAFEALFETATRLRKGDLQASGAHRDAIAKLRARAARILVDAGHAATEGTLRKVTQTLAALAATGDWGSDAAGTLTDDRDPPGFEAIGIGTSSAESAPLAKHATKATHATHTTHATDAEHASEPASSRDELADARRRKEAAELANREAAAAERKQQEQERARIKAETHRLEAALRTAKGEMLAQQRAVEKLRAQLADAEDNLGQAEAIAEDLQAKLDDLK